MIYIIIAIISLFKVFSAIRTNKSRAIAVSLVIAATLLLLNFGPYLYTTSKINYNLNKDNYLNSVEAFKKGELEHYHAEANVYAACYPLTSYNGQIVVQEHGNKLKMKFYVYTRFSKKQIIVFDSTDVGIEETDFSPATNVFFEYDNVRKLAPNWFCATQKHAYQLIDTD
ncbi:MAG: hypothetical protein IJG50_08735 [Clostridia bacterium]|nr:hypothetical protein [Clostridia bacterium]